MYAESVRIAQHYNAQTGLEKRNTCSYLKIKLAFKNDELSKSALFNFGLQ